MPTQLFCKKFWWLALGEDKLGGGAEPRLNHNTLTKIIYLGRCGGAEEARSLGDCCGAEGLVASRRRLWQRACGGSHFRSLRFECTEEFKPSPSYIIEANIGLNINGCKKEQETIYNRHNRCDPPIVTKQKHIYSTCFMFIYK
ncbi:hypothetical protein VNO80_00437 [Phaseolus coccineus]|uniref:Uncharacterized protein n=1 Tax=Phaseolus coccineus TaxID=3886 RepID=A0AAN9RSF7_PHACN